MKIKCPICAKVIPSSQTNIATDLAFCEKCNESFSISEFIEMASLDTDPLNEEPPKGAWLKRGMFNIVVGASTRSPIAFFLIPFMCVWSGGALMGIYGSQIKSGQFDLRVSLLGVPFLLGTIVLGAWSLMTIIGKVEVSVGNDSSVFVGIGSFGWTRRFDWQSVKSIKEGYSKNDTTEIVLDGKKHLKFGSGLNEDRKHYLIKVLKYLKYKGANKSL
ncbi:MAG: hypothetical protein MI742_07150 [Desulfobacterales bacterium]|nr:hypothetical protein [Desulfobacterales bacterium]